MYEGAPNFPEPDRFLEDCGEVWRDDFVHSADSDPRVHEMGGVEWPKKHNLSFAAVAGARSGGTDQSRSVDVVSRSDRWEALSRSSTPGGRPKTGGIMITPHSRSHPDEARHGHVAIFLEFCPKSSMTKATRSPKRVGRQTGHSQNLGRECCEGSGGDPKRLQGSLLERGERELFYGRRFAARIRTGISGSWVASTMF